MTTPAPSHVGPYELRQELGRGGIGQVWRAWDPAIRREVAVKVLLREAWQLTPESRARFAREAEALARVDDPGLVRVHHMQLDATPPYLVMELVPGETLAALLKRSGQMPEAETVRIALDLARTLARLHAGGVAHRDLKPGNVILRPDGRTVLLDFGLALVLDRATRLTESGVIMGTPGFMPPEQAAGEASRMGPASDVYAFGALLFALLTGRPPFQGPPVQVIAAVLDRDPPLVSSLRDGVDPRLTDLVRECLAKSPGERPQALELVASLESITRTTEDQPSPPLPTQQSRLVVLLAGSLLFFLALVGVTTAALLRSRPAPADPAQQSEPFTALAWASRGHACLEQGDLIGAIDHASRAIALDPKLPGGYAVRGSAKLDQGDTAGAIEDLARAIAIEPRYGNARSVLAEARRRLGDHKGAIAEATRAIEIDPLDAEAWMVRGATRGVARDPSGALEDLNRAIELAPTTASSWGFRASARRQLGDDRGAIADATRAIELNPKISAAWADRGAARRKAGDLAGALEDSARAVDLNPREAFAWGVRCEALIQQGDLPGAIGAATRQIELDPHAINAWVNRGLAHIDRGELDAGIEDLTEALKLDPGFAPT